MSTNNNNNNVRPEPVNGNQNFSNVFTIANQIDSITSSNTVIQSVVSDMVTGQFTWNNFSTERPEQIQMITGHTPTTFLGLADGSSVFLNTNPGQPPATTVQGGVLTLPHSVSIIGAYAIDPTVSGPDTINIGTNLVTGNQPTNNGNLFTTTPANLALGTQVTAALDLSSATLGSAGTAPFQYTIDISDTGTVGISVTPVGDSIATSSGLRVNIFYLINYIPPVTY